MPVSDRAKAGLAAFIRSVVGLNILGPRLDYTGRFPAKVVAQNTDGSLELQPDDKRLPGYSKVPIRYGIPGVTATVPSGARCLLSFAVADPQQPIVADWEPGTVLTVVLAGGANGVARTTDAVSAATLMAAWITAVNTALSGTGAASKVPGLTAPTDFGTITGGSTKVKAG